MEKRKKMFSVYTTKLVVKVTDFMHFLHTQRTGFVSFAHTTLYFSQFISKPRNLGHLIHKKKIVIAPNYFTVNSDKIEEIALIKTYLYFKPHRHNHFFKKVSFYVEFAMKEREREEETERNLYRTSNKFFFAFSRIILTISDFNDKYFNVFRF